MTRLKYLIKTYFINIDKLLLPLMLISSVYGIFLIYSATLSFGTLRYVKVQIYATVIGIVLFLIMAALDMEKVSKFWLLLFILNLLCLGSLYFFGVGEGGNRSWIRFAGIGVQPAEICKIIFIVTFAKHLSMLGERLNSTLSVLCLLCHAGITAAFVVIFSKDDGMMLVYLFIALFMMLAAGVKLRWFFALGIIGVSLTPLIWNLLIDKYQKLRILTIFNPELDEATSWQAGQCRKAIVSGGLTGMGYTKGKLTQASLIPAKHHDSIFAVAGEELGVLGCIAIIILLMLIILRCVYIAVKSGRTEEGHLSPLIAAGVAGMLIFQTILNVGMNLGVLPVVGLTLPLFSYGGSSVVAMYAALGLVAGVRRRQQTLLS